MQDPVSASTRRIVIRAALLLAPVVVAALVVPRILERRTDDRDAAVAVEHRERPPSDGEIAAAVEARRRLSDAQRVWEGATTISPHDSRPAGDGEAVRRFDGFGVSVTSTPPGARVLVNGRDVGDAPVVASVACEPGERVDVVVRRGARAVRRTTSCRADTLVEWNVVLGARARGADR